MYARMNKPSKTFGETPFQVDLCNRSRSTLKQAAGVNLRPVLSGGHIASGVSSESQHGHAHPPEWKVYPSPESN